MEIAQEIPKTKKSKEFTQNPKYIYLAILLQLLIGILSIPFAIKNRDIRSAGLLIDLFIFYYLISRESEFARKFLVFRLVMGMVYTTVIAGIALSQQLIGEIILLFSVNTSILILITGKSKRWRFVLALCVCVPIIILMLVGLAMELRLRWNM